MKTKVWVVMGNDFPDAVFSSEEKATAYCAEKKKEPSPGARIHWRSYEFELQ